MDVPTMYTTFVAFGFETDDTMTAAVQLDALNETYWDICSREPWPFLEKSATLTYSGSSGIATNNPTDLNQALLAVRTADGQRLEPWRLDDFYQTYGSALTTVGSPMLYFFEAGVLNVYPVPNTTDTVLIKYLKTPAALTQTSVETDIIIPPKWHRQALVLGTLSRLAMIQDDTDMAAAYGNLYEKALANMVADLFDQQSDRPDFIHVNDPDNWDYS